MAVNLTAGGDDDSESEQGPELAPVRPCPPPPLRRTVSAAIIAPNLPLRAEGDIRERH